jgi:hypothetical protein
MTDGRGGRTLQDVSDALERLWDPIGVYEGPEDGHAPPGEYDLYAADVLELLRRGTTSSELAVYFNTVATKQMGLQPSDEATRSADAVIAWYDGADHQ